MAGATVAKILQVLMFWDLPEFECWQVEAISQVYDRLSASLKDCRLRKGETLEGRCHQIACDEAIHGKNFAGWLSAEQLEEILLFLAS